MGFVKITNTETNTVTHDSRLENPLDLIPYLPKAEQEYIESLIDMVKNSTSDRHQQQIAKVINQALIRAYDELIEREQVGGK